MAGMNVLPDELEGGDLIDGDPGRIVRSVQKNPGGQFVTVVCRSGPDYFAEAGKTLWIVRK